MGEVTGQFIPEDETYRIDLGDGKWVEVRRHLTTGDRRAANSQAMVIRAKARVGEKPEDAEATFDAGLWGLTILKRMIVRWSDPKQVTPQNIERMPDYIADRILAEIDRLNPGRSEEQKGGSTAGSLPASDAPAEGIPAGPGPESCPT